MALAFNIKQCAVLKGKSADGSAISVPGVTTANITPAYAAEQASKLLALGGKSIVADESMSRVQTEEVVDNE